MSTRRKKANAQLLLDFFMEHGRILDEQEYCKMKDVPVKPRGIRQMFGSWKRLLRTLEAYDSEAYDNLMDPLTQASIDKKKALRLNAQKLILEEEQAALKAKKKADAKEDARLKAIADKIAEIEQKEIEARNERKANMGVVLERRRALKEAEDAKKDAALEEAIAVKSEAMKLMTKAARSGEPNELSLEQVMEQVKKLREDPVDKAEEAKFADELKKQLDAEKAAKEEEALKRAAELEAKLEAEAKAKAEAEAFKQ